MINIILFGAPGSGKGTLASFLVKEYGFKHLSTGHIFRKEFYSNPKYKKLKEDLEAGKFASDDLAIKITEDFIDSHKDSRGIVFDGFPRNLNQAESLEKILLSRGMGITLVIDLEISREEIIKRVSGRYSCRDCGATYHDTFNPTKVEGICDSCGSTDLYRREEDSNVEALKERIQIYKNTTMKLKDFYCEKGLLYTVDSSKGKENVQIQFKNILKTKFC